MASGKESRFSLTFDFTVDDSIKTSAILCRRAMGKPPPYIGVAFAVGVIALIAILQPTPDSLLFPTGVGLFFFLMCFVMVRRNRARMLPHPQGSILDERTLEFDSNHIAARTRNWQSTGSWSGILAVEETDGYVLLLLDTVLAFSIPVRVFESEVHVKEFVAFARRQLRRTTLHATRLTRSSRAHDATPPATWLTA